VGSKVTTSLVRAENDRVPAGAVAAATARRFHLLEYALEALEIGLFMLSACVTTTLLEHPASPLRALIEAPGPRRLLIGVCMALTAASLIYSALGKRSGAHMNPAVTLTFLRLGKIARLDAAGYVLAQLLGALGGVLLSQRLLGQALAHPSVAFAVTVPGPRGAGVAFLAELAISCGLMLVILLVSNHPRHAHKTGLVAAALVAAFITFEAPLSGMSMNPARTLGSALVAQRFDALWIYLLAPPLGMLSAAELYLRCTRARAARKVHCAKLEHGPGQCIFRCQQAELVARARSMGNAREGASTQG
jgi:aquaporin Z